MLSPFHSCRAIVSFDFLSPATAPPLAPIEMGPAGEEVHASKRSLLWKDVYIRRIYDPASHALVYVSYSYRISQDMAEQNSRFRTSIAGEAQRYFSEHWTARREACRRLTQCHRYQCRALARSYPDFFFLGRASHVDGSFRSLRYRN